MYDAWPQITFRGNLLGSSKVKMRPQANLTTYCSVSQVFHAWPLVTSGPKLLGSSIGTPLSPPDRPLIMLWSFIMTAGHLRGHLLGSSMGQDAPSSLALVRTSSMGTTTAAPGQSQQQAQHPQQQLADDAINVNALPFLNDWDGSACEAEQVGDGSST